MFKACEGLAGKQYADCAAKVPTACDVIQKADEKHPEHTCQRSCRKARCNCHDTEPCDGPSLTEGVQHSEDN